MKRFLLVIGILGIGITGYADSYGLTVSTTAYFGDTVTAASAVYLGTATATSYLFNQIDLTPYLGTGAYPLTLGTRTDAAATGNDGLFLYTIGSSSVSLSADTNPQIDFLGCDPILDPTDCAVTGNGGLVSISLNPNSNAGTESIQEFLMFNRPGHLGEFSFDDYDSTSQNFQNILLISTQTFNIEEPTIIAFSTTAYAGGVAGNAYLAGLSEDAGSYAWAIDSDGSAVFNTLGLGPLNYAEWKLIVNSSNTLFLTGPSNNSPLQLEPNAPQDEMDLTQNSVYVGTSITDNGSLQVNGSVNISGTGAPTQGHALCINSSGTLSTCSSAVASDGSCTCN